MIEMPVKKNQTFIDFAVQHSGAIDEIINTAILNGIGITDDVAPGTILKVEPTVTRVTKVFTTGNLDITSNMKDMPMGGIGYMQIGTNFIVS